MSEIKVDNYTNDSIGSLGDEIEAIRHKPASIGIENHNHLFTEVLANSIDEAREGYGNIIEVIKHKDLSITIKDMGRGIPVGKNSKGEYVYKQTLCKLWSGGKINNTKNKGVYLFSLGTNGCGLKATNFCSDLFQCTSFRDGRKYFIEFKKGRQQCEIQEEKYNYEHTGTIITWKPSIEVFRTGDDTDIEFIKTMLKQQSIVNQGLKFTLKDEINNTYDEFYYENGIIDFINEYGENNNLTDIIYWSTETEGKDSIRKNDDKEEINEPYKIKCNIAFTFNNMKQLMDFYHNGSYLANGGTPEDFIKTSFVYAIDKYLSDNKMYEKNDKKIKYDDIKDSLIIISDTYSTISLYTDQAKKKIDSDLMKKHMIDYIKEQLEIYFTENTMEAKLICNTILNNMRANRKADKAKQEIKKKLQGGESGRLKKIEGLKDCDKDAPFELKEIWFSEGISPSQTMDEARDEYTMGLFPLRGRFINALKSSMKQVLNNKPALGMINALGCGVEIPKEERKLYNNINLFNKNNLRYNKIIIATDADSFGHGITLSLIAFFYRYMKPLLIDGHIYISISPRYEITYKDELYFAYNESEKNKMVEDFRNKGKNVNVGIVKGLGQLSKDTFWTHVMNPENRILKQITYQDAEDLIKYYFDILIGDDIEGRKKYVKENITNVNYEEID